MPASTPVYGFPYPVGTDRVMDGDNAIGALAQAVEDVLAATDVNRVLGHAIVTANQINIVAEIDLTGLSVTVTVPAGRLVRVSAQVTLTSATVGGDIGRVLIREGATALQYANVPNAVTSPSASAGASPFVILTPSAGAHTYRLAAQRILGTGSISLNASAGNPAILLVEDIGKV